MRLRIKNKTAIWNLVFSLLFFVTATSSQELPKAVLVDEFNNLFCSDDLKARLDNFFSKIAKQPESVGYIVGNADASMPGRFHKYLRVFQSYVSFRGFYQDRLGYFRGPDGDGLKFQFWLVPKSAVRPSVSTEFRQQRMEKATLFDASEISSIKNGSVEFGGDWGNEPCDFGLNFYQFAIELGANRNLLGYLVASSSGKRNRTRTRTALQQTAAELIKRHRIPARRLKTLFVGDHDNSEMQLWLVPKGTGLPRFQSRLPD